MKSYFCILYSKFLKVKPTELKCQNNLNSHSQGGQSHSEHTCAFLLFLSILSWEQMAEMTEVMSNGKTNREQVIDKSQLPWGRWGEELTYLRWCQGLASWHLHQRMGLSSDIPRVIGNHSLKTRRRCEANRHSHLFSQITPPVFHSFAHYSPNINVSCLPRLSLMFPFFTNTSHLLFSPSQMSLLFPDFYSLNPVKEQDFFLEVFYGDFESSGVLRLHLPYPFKKIHTGRQIMAFSTYWQWSVC